MRIVSRREFLAGLSAGSALFIAGCQTQSAQHPTKPTSLSPFVGLQPGSPAIVYPAFVVESVRDGYEFAVSRPDVLSVLPCYCGCGMTAGHKSNLDCFVAGVDKSGAVILDDHGSYCQTCLDIARDAKVLVAQGRSLPEVRRLIDERHSGKGPGTDTPKPVAQTGPGVR